VCVCVCCVLCEVVCLGAVLHSLRYTYCANL